jgi:hypothetical protein
MPRSILVGQAFLPDTIKRGVRQESLTYGDAHYQATPLLESRGRAAAPSFSLWTGAAIGDIVPSTRLKNSSIGFSVSTNPWRASVARRATAVGLLRGTDASHDVERIGI